MKITIKEPCALVFDCIDSNPLFIYMNNGVEYHKRKENGRVVVNFPIPAIYKTNYKPVEIIPIHNFYDPKYSFDTNFVRIKQGNQTTPVAYIDLQENCIYVCRGFHKINFPPLLANALVNHKGKTKANPLTCSILVMK